MTILLPRKKFVAFRAGVSFHRGDGPDSYFLGPDQLLWLKRALLSSRATWKVIASDMPLSIIVYDDAPTRRALRPLRRATARRVAASSKSPICRDSSRP